MVGDILQPTHLLFILVVALLVLGPKRLPEVGRTLGSGLRDFRAAINGEATEPRPADSHHQQSYIAAEPTPDAGEAAPAIQFADPPPASATVDERPLLGDSGAETADEPPLPGDADVETAASGTASPLFAQALQGERANRAAAEPPAERTA